MTLRHHGVWWLAYLIMVWAFVGLFREWWWVTTTIICGFFPVGLFPVLGHRPPREVVFTHGVWFMAYGVVFWGAMRAQEHVRQHFTHEVVPQEYY